jgi:hypothetical protein
MRFTATRTLLAAILVVGATACEMPLRPEVDAAIIAPSLEAKVCADASDPICAVFSSTVYQYSPALGALPPGVSDWRLIITQYGGQLEFLGAVSHGGAPIANIENMYVRFFIDNGDATLGAGDLQVVVRNTPIGAQLHCGIVTSLPVGATLPTASPAICENGGTSINEPGRFIFDGFRTADLSAPLWEAQGFARLRADERRALFLVEVGNVSVATNGDATLEAPTAPATRVDTLSIVPPNGGGDGDGDGDGDDDGDGDTDTTAPTITFGGNAGSYGLMDQVNITCVATDAGSGIATVNCPTVNALAYTLALSTTTLQASATDIAGNTATASTMFTVTADANSLCTLARSFVSNAGQGNALCAQLRNSTKAFANHVRSQRGKALSNAHADILLALAATL